MRTNKEWALDYAARGLRVFPCHFMTTNGCSCGKPDCKSSAKHPRTSRGHNDATTEPALVSRWWDDCAEANIGIATGEGSGVWVLDLDGPEGLSALAEMEERRGELPETVTSNTGGGGRHVFFRWDAASPVKSKTKLSGKKIDTRGNGGYVIAPPSNHRSGTPYSWVHAPGGAAFAPAPEWLMEFVQCEDGAGASARQRDESTFRELVQALNLEADAGAPEGERHGRAVKLVASALGRGLSVPRTTALALEWGQRCEPPLDPEELVPIVEWAAGKESDKLDQPGVIQAVEWPVRREGAFYGLAGEIVRAIEPVTESDLNAILAQLLVFFGNTVGRQPHFQVESTAHNCNLFAVVVGDTAKGRKGTSADRVRELFRCANPLFRYSREATGLSSGEGLITQVRDPMPRTEAAKGRGEFDIHLPQGVLDKRLIVVEPEFASVLRSARRDGNILSAVIRSAWDSGNLDTLVKNAPVKATNAHISIIGHITQVELQRLLSDVEVFNGFANRFLWVAARRSQFLPDGGGPLDLAAFRTRLVECIDFATGVGRLTRDDEAAARWRELYRILGSPQPGLFGSVTARSEAQVLRLSMIYALLDKSAVIRREHLDAAFDLWRYCEDSARHIFGTSTGDALADKLLAAIREQPRTMRDLHKALSGHCSSDQLRATLRRMAGQGLVECRKESSGGRPSEIWHARG